MTNVGSLVSVDVIALRYNADLRRVEFATKPRTADPYRGVPALPGVLLREGERLAAAAHRAVIDKVGFDVSALGQLTVFDQPNRDPRGYSLSVAMWAVGDGDADWYGFDDVPRLAFDHNVMLFECRPLLVDMLWRDLEFTQALTGAEFPVSAAVGITHTLSGIAPDRGNLNRRLASLRGLDVSTKRMVLGRGRPGTVWEWKQPAA